MLRKLPVVHQKTQSWEIVLLSGLNLCALCVFVVKFADHGEERQ